MAECYPQAAQAAYDAGQDYVEVGTLPPAIVRWISEDKVLRDIIRELMKFGITDADLQRIIKIFYPDYSRLVRLTNLPPNIVDARRLEIRAACRSLIALLPRRLRKKTEVVMLLERLGSALEAMQFDARNADKLDRILGVVKVEEREGGGRRWRLW